MANVGTAALIINALRGQAAARGQSHGTLPASSDRYYASSVWSNEGDVSNVRFGSKQTPAPQKVMSALPRKRTCAVH
jgi:hypothetical protein